MNKKTNVLILGGNGFIGTNLAQCLIKKDYEVYSFDRVCPDRMDERIHYIMGDFFDDRTLNEIIQDKDVVYHAVSTITPGNSNVEYMRGYEKDFIQTVKLCNLLKGRKCRLVFLSSGGTVYGRQLVQPIKESALPRPINHYGNIKLCIENTLLTFACQDNLDIIIARISNPYGPGQDYRKGVGFIDAVIKKALAQEPVEIWGDGNVVRDYIHISDVCQALSILSDDVKIEGNILNISSGVGTSLNQIVEAIQSIHGSIEVQYKAARNVDLQKVVLDNTKLRMLMDMPLCDIKTGIEAYYHKLCADDWA